MKLILQIHPSPPKINRHLCLKTQKIKIDCFSVGTLHNEVKFVDFDCFSVVKFVNSFWRKLWWSWYTMKFHKNQMCNVEDLFLDIKYDLKLEEKIVYNDYFVLVYS